MGMKLLLTSAAVLFDPFGQGRDYSLVIHELQQTVLESGIGANPPTHHPTGEKGQYGGGENMETRPVHQRIAIIGPDHCPGRHKGPDHEQYRLDYDPEVDDSQAPSLPAFRL